MLDEPMREHAPTEPHAPTTSALMAEATAAHTAGDLAKAKALYQRLLALSPPSPEAAHGLGWLLVQEGDWRGALPCFARAIALRPWEKEFWISQLEALMQVGQHEAVHRLLHRASQSGLPASAIAHFEDRLRDRRTERLAQKVRASGKTPQQAAQAPHGELMLLRKAFLERDFATAKSKAEALVSAYPLCAFAWRVLGASQPGSDEGDSTIEVLRIACDLDPANVDVTLNLALALQERHRLDEAEALYTTVLEQQPDNVRALVNAGLLLNLRGDPRAEEFLRKARSLGVSDHRVALALGGYLRDRDQHEEALPLLESALAVDPENPSCIAALSVCYLGVGRHEEAARLFRRLDTGRTAHLGALGIALFVGAHIAEIGAEELFAMHARYGELLEGRIVPLSQWENERNAARRLRVGFVSGDYRNHAMSGFIKPLWAGLDRSQFELFAYSNHRANDQVTAQLKALVDEWHDITGLSDERASELVRKHRIDVLVDLSGHTAFNRLGLFAHKPAPVQISSYGYPATTGLTRMDYYLADTIFAPPGMLDAQFTEKLMLGSANAAFQPPEAAPLVERIAESADAPFTFGSFNRMSKITPHTVRLWARALHAAPAARLLIGAADTPGEARLRAQFDDAGVDQGRLEFLPRLDTRAYLEAHGRVDVLLDTCPYAGGTTTCIGLWMGVPTLTVPSATLPSRAGAAILRRVGLEAFIADSPDDFVARAATLASPASAENLRELREGLRAQVARSSIVSSRPAIESFEDGVRSAWRRWCEGLPPASMVIPPRSG